MKPEALSQILSHLFFNSMSLETPLLRIQIHFPYSRYPLSLLSGKLRAIIINSPLYFAVRNGSDHRAAIPLNTLVRVALKSRIHQKSIRAKE